MSTKDEQHTFVAMEISKQHDRRFEVRSKRDSASKRRRLYARRACKTWREVDGGTAEVAAQLIQPRGMYDKSLSETIAKGHETLRKANAAAMTDGIDLVDALGPNIVNFGDMMEMMAEFKQENKKIMQQNKEIMQQYKDIKQENKDMKKKMADRENAEMSRDRDFALEALRLELYPVLSDTIADYANVSGAAVLVARIIKGERAATWKHSAMPNEAAANDLAHSFQKACRELGEPGAFHIVSKKERNTRVHGEQQRMLALYIFDKKRICPPPNKFSAAHLAKFKKLKPDIKWVAEEADLEKLTADFKFMRLQMEILLSHDELWQRVVGMIDDLS